MIIASKLCLSFCSNLNRSWDIFDSVKCILQKYKLWAPVTQAILRIFQNPSKLFVHLPKGHNLQIFIKISRPKQNMGPIKKMPKCKFLLRMSHTPTIFPKNIRKIYEKNSTFKNLSKEIRCLIPRQYFPIISGNFREFHLLRTCLKRFVFSHPDNIFQ